MAEQQYNRWLILIAAIVTNLLKVPIPWSVFALPMGNCMAGLGRIGLAFTSITYQPVAMIVAAQFRTPRRPGNILVGGSCSLSVSSFPALSQSRPCCNHLQHPSGIGAALSTRTLASPKVLPR
jgi:hypothetical protein